MTSQEPGAEGPTRRQLPEGFGGRLRALIRELEEQAQPAAVRAAPGEIEFKVSETEALWFVAYKTAAE